MTPFKTARDEMAENRNPDSWRLNDEFCAGWDACARYLLGSELKQAENALEEFLTIYGVSSKYFDARIKGQRALEALAKLRKEVES